MPGAPGELGFFDGAGWAGRGGAPGLSRVRGDPAESGVKLTPLCAQEQDVLFTIKMPAVY